MTQTLKELRKAEAQAKAAFAAATQARVAAERQQQQLTAREGGSWLRNQMEAAAGDTPKAEFIVVRADYAVRTILWDVLCDSQPGLSRFRDPSRSWCDRYARGLRAKGHAVRVVQAAV